MPLCCLLRALKQSQVHALNGAWRVADVLRDTVLNRAAGYRQIPAVLVPMAMHGGGAPCPVSPATMQARTETRLLCRDAPLSKLSCCQWQLRLHCMLTLHGEFYRPVSFTVLVAVWPWARSAQ